MLDSYSYILVELLKRNTKVHGAALQKKGLKDNWTITTVRILNKEIQASAVKSDTKLKAASGYIWAWIIRQGLTTRHVYHLLLQWALYLTEQNQLHTYTKAYADILEELKVTIEAGAEGTVEDVSSEDIIQEWQFMQEHYYSALHNLCDKLVKEIA